MAAMEQGGRVIEPSKTQGYLNECAGSEQVREREIASRYMREKHGLVENKKPDYRPVKGGRSYRPGR